MTWQEVKIRNERRAIEIFQHFISFLEIYGQENFGENVEINWPGVYSNCVEFGLFDENPDVEEIVNVNSEEEFRDKMFSWIEKQVLDGYPIWRLFKLNNWLYEQLEKELHENEYKKDIEYFNKHKCFTCKYFYDDIYWLDKESKLMYEYNEGKGDGYHIPSKYQKLYHQMLCNKRKEQADNHKKKYSWTDDIENNFKFKPFNLNDETQFDNDSSKWLLYPEKMNKCPYYKKDENMSFEEFIRKYNEILR